MPPDVFWIDRVGEGLVGIMPRPRGGQWLDRDVRSLAKAGVNVIVSLLTADEVAELELQDEERLCGDCNITFISFPITDRDVPLSILEAKRAVHLLLEKLRAGKNVAVHCRMGIGRSALVAACVLKCQDIAADEAFAMIGKARGFSVPDTDEQKAWVREFSVERDNED
jgi:protein-tyrosine phosphatase